MDLYFELHADPKNAVDKKLTVSHAANITSL